MVAKQQQQIVGMNEQYEAYEAMGRAEIIIALMHRDAHLARLQEQHKQFNKRQGLSCPGKCKLPGQLVAPESQRNPLVQQVQYRPGLRTLSKKCGYNLVHNRNLAGHASGSTVIQMMACDEMHGGFTDPHSVSGYALKANIAQRTADKQLHDEMKTTLVDVGDAMEVEDGAEDKWQSWQMDVHQYKRSMPVC